MALVERRARWRNAAASWDELDWTRSSACRPLALATDLPHARRRGGARRERVRPHYRRYSTAAFGDCRDHARADRVRARELRAHARERRDGVGSLRTPATSARSTGRALYGWRALQDVPLHRMPHAAAFTNNEFFQIGVRRAALDRGRRAVTHDPEDAGDDEGAELRNAAL